MSIPANLKYTDSHEWARSEADGTVTVGITHHAQDLLGDLVFVENPALGRKLKKGEECGVVESVKAASDIYAPISGGRGGKRRSRIRAGEINEGAYDPGCSVSSPATRPNWKHCLIRGLSELVEAEAH